jgi:hypothetical protein
LARGSFAVSCEVSEHGRRAGAEPPLLGLWCGAQDDDSVSFATDSADPPVWRVSVSGHLQDAYDWIAVSTAKVRDSASVLESINRRVEDAVEASFVAPSFRTDHAAADLGDAELAAWLYEARLATEVDVPSFAAGGPARSWTLRAWDDVAAFMQRLQRWTEPRTHVETRTDDVLVGSSVIEWAGGIKTVWSSDLRSDQSALHVRAVELAVQSRARLFGTLGATARAASTVAARLVVPGGAVLALPPLWRFINRAVGELVTARKGYLPRPS